MTRSTRTSIRLAQRQARRVLDDAQRAVAASAVHRLVTHTEIFRRSKRIASYVAFDGEINPATIAATAIGLGKELYLPVIGSGNRLRFAYAAPDIPLANNRFGIAEPAPGYRWCIDPRRLDLVLTPLVAFDAAGFRLGMGAGYYDECFSFLIEHRHWLKPKLIGIGYDFQRIDDIDASVRDVPMWCIATDRAIYASDSAGRKI